MTTSPKATADWQPEQYLRFRGERTQPTIDLAARIDVPEPKRIIDIGCGPGNSTAVLEALWPGASVTGLDSSESMLEKARKTSSRITWVKKSAADDLSSLGAFDIIFSNAAFQWIPDLERVIPALYAMLNTNGVLAVQAPYVRETPVYAAIGSVTAKPEWQGYFAEPVIFPRHHPYTFYYSVLCDLADELVLWQTDYMHVLDSAEAVVEWYKGSGLRPFLDKLPDEAAQKAFTGEYTELIRAAYPPERNGKVILPFRRVFFLAYKR